MRQKNIRSALVLASAGVSISAAFAYISVHHQVDAATRHPSWRQQSDDANPRLMATSAFSFQRSAARSYATSCDLYYQKHRRIPVPKTIHADLTTISETSDPSSDTRGILVIGDVHGCYEEMLLLHEKAVAENGHRPFSFVILVGDLCNKGPDSVKVIRHVRTHYPTWLAVRGNHDDSALAAALGDELRRQKPTYQWTWRRQDDETDKSLSDEDVLWLSELPYTIRIPSSIYGDSSEEVDTLIVHAGLTPNMPLENQSTATMVTLRNVCKILDSPGEYVVDVPQDANESPGQYGTPEPWAHAWKGPFHVVFGHDAKRGLQQYPWATGLDTGCCYGKQLTGLILPERRLVGVDALKAHSPITGKK